MYLDFLLNKIDPIYFRSHLHELQLQAQLFLIGVLTKSKSPCADALKRIYP